MTFNRPNVTLVDAAGEGIQGIDARGVVVNGEHFELDCLIFATGYEVNTSYSHRIGFDPRGRDGLALSHHWSQGIRTLHGLMAHGFPNMMVVPGLNSQAVVTTNFMHTFSECARHIAYVVATVCARGATVFEVTAEAEDEWVRTILGRAPARGAFLESCTPGRRNYEGRLDKWPAQNANYSARPTEFFRLLEDWRADNRLRGLEVTS
jgi:cyclohexanone monooxygenase